jgi:CDP-paratose 2-epimerase
LAEQNRTGDHHWWISDNQKFMDHFPSWRVKYDLETIISEMV